MPDIENSRKTAEKGAEWVTVRQPKNSRENSRNTRRTVKTAVFRVFRLFSRLFFGCFTVTHLAPFSAVFQPFSMSGIWHLCSWPQRSQDQCFEKFHLVVSVVSIVPRHTVLSGPPNWLNAILSLLQPLDRYRIPSAIGSAIGRPYLALSRILAQVGVLNRLVQNRLGGSTAR